MIEENAVHREQAVSFPVVADHPVGIQFGHRIGTPGQHGCIFILGRGGRAIELTRRSLVKTRLNAAAANGLQQPGRPQAANVPGGFRHVETHPHVTLGCQVINLVRLQIVDHMAEQPGVGHVPVVQEQPHSDLTGVHIEMLDAPGIEGAGPPHQAMHFITLPQQQFCQITAVLAADACD